MTTITRQQRRFQEREAIKAFEKAKNTREYKDMKRYFDTLGKEDYLLLQDRTHPDLKKQEVFDRYERDMKDFIGLEARKDMLIAMRPTPSPKKKAVL